jgi:hypothetical protein
MPKATRIIFITCLLFTLAAAVQAAGLAYDLPWWTADSGGSVSQGGSYSLSATIGQVDAGTLQGSSYSLAGGFWSGAPSALVTTKYQIALPLLKK